MPSVPPDDLVSARSRRFGFLTWRTVDSLCFFNGGLSESSPLLSSSLLFKGAGRGVLFLRRAVVGFSGVLLDELRDVLRPLLSDGRNGPLGGTRRVERATGCWGFGRCRVVLVVITSFLMTGGWDLIADVAPVCR